MPRTPLRLTTAAIRSSLLVMGAGLAALPGLAQAQSLKTLYEAARAYDATYLAARALADSAVHKAAQANALKLPSAQLTGSASRAESNLPGANNTALTNATLTAEGSYTLFNRANNATFNQAQRALELARSDLDSAEQDLIVRVAQAYFDVLAAQDALSAQQAAKKATTEQLASAKRNFEVGTATITDTREAQARFDLDQARELVAENDLQTKRVALDQLVGRAGVVPRGPVLPLVLPAVLPANADEWVNQAEDRHPGIRKARLGMEVARLETEKAKAGHLPTVNLIGRLAGSDSRGTAVTDSFGRPGTTTTTTVGVQLAVPLFSGYAIQNRVKETLVLEDKARQDLEAARRAVALGTRSAFLGVQSLQGQVKALEAAESSTKLALDATQLGYKVGVRVNLDVLNAQSQLYNTQRDLAKARYDALLTSLKLRQAAGLLQPGDVDALEALLAK
ncbi:TolC family outer membrane protein [Aquabacterium sp. OR-4]|uniref:TolC family outer membrane protein n=1 Tax=Aquabacterium sp. OR-4 TaxID=2978127 RepID=UPI0028CA9CF4|nr:TolC family outer membrane protein [Aquabacterium sp. OR-4]MDT7834811.1 TolC family outer membrane protein [Aquabacterium sp. OR-4]